MKATGKTHPFTGQEIMQLEEHDIKFWHKDFAELTIDEMADYCSFKGIASFGRHNMDKVEALYYSDSH